MAEQAALEKRRRDEEAMRSELAAALSAAKKAEQQLAQMPGLRTEVEQMRTQRDEVSHQGGYSSDT